MPITCGPTGSTGQQIADAINASTDAITTINSAPISLVYCTTALASQALTSTPSVITVGNAVRVVRPGIPITSYNTFTFPSDGWYEIQFNMSVSCANDDVIIFSGLFNSTPSVENSYVTGRGAGEPVTVSWSTIVQSAANDTLKVTAASVDASASLVIHSSSFYIKKV